MIRASSRKHDELRDIKIETNVNKYAEGSCLISFGDTKVICTASLDNKIPHFLRGQNMGWVSAEYGMLPRSTHNRCDREALKGQTGRTKEIQRLIARSLRAIVDLEKMSEKHIRVDCDVIQADGGTRTAAITGSYVALYLAFSKLINKKIIDTMPLKEHVAAVSCGIFNGVPLLDLDYSEDSKADVDANFIMTSKNHIVEIQASAEKTTFDKDTLDKMMVLAEKGINILINKQQKAILNSKQ